MNFITKIILKTTNRNRYQRMRLAEQSKKFLEKAKASQVELPASGKPVYSFKHSGNSGDIIYSLPSIYALSENAACKLYLNLYKQVSYSIVRGEHSMNNVMLNQQMFSMLKPLLLEQPKITSCEPYEGQSIDYDLDIIRKSAFPLNAGHIARWYFLHFGINADLGKPWLRAKPNKAFTEYIVIARSLGYHSPGIDYSFLNKYGKLLFLGIPKEFEAMRNSLPRLEYHKVVDFLEMAEIIAGCRFFIGNQSFPFSIAEALKIKRVLEVCYHCPNVIVEGSSGYDFCFQPQFEQIIKHLTEE